LGSFKDLNAYIGTDSGLCFILCYEDKC
jgi:hypothetical protein